MKALIAEIGAAQSQGSRLLPLLAEVLAALERSQGRLDIAQGGRTVAALVSADYLESLEETIAVATDPELMAAIAEGETELNAGQGIPAHEIEAEFLNRP